MAVFVSRRTTTASSLLSIKSIKEIDVFSLSFGGEFITLAAIFDNDLEFSYE